MSEDPEVKNMDRMPIGCWFFLIIGIIGTYIGITKIFG